MKSYKELVTIPTFEERCRYLRLGGLVGKDTFGFDRYLNQMLYRDAAWLEARRNAIVRDGGFDLACKDRPIAGSIFVHHIEPITKEDILERNAKVLDPDNLICCSKATHDLIHYGIEQDFHPLPIERKPNDTCPWKTGGKFEKR